MHDFSGPVDIGKRLGLNQPSIDYEKLVKSLNDTVAQKEELIKTLHSEFNSLKSEKEALLTQLNELLGNPCENQDVQEQLDSYKEKLDTYTRIIEQKDAAINQLQEKLQEHIAASGNTVNDQNTLGNQELINSYKIKIGEYFGIITEKDNEITNLKNKISELSSNRSQGEDYRSECEELKSESDVPITSSQISLYLINTIKSFNQQAGLLDSTVNYVIDTIDVEFKARFLKNGNNDIIIDTLVPSQEGTSCTNIKFSIKSISKETK